MRHPGPVLWTMGILIYLLAGCGGDTPPQEDTASLLDDIAEDVVDTPDVEVTPDVAPSYEGPCPGVQSPNETGCEGLPVGSASCDVGTISECIAWD